MASRTWIGMGMMAVTYGVGITSCSPVVPITATPNAEVASREALQPVAFTEATKNGTDAAARVDDLRLSRALPLWESESGPDGDSFSAGVAAFEMASVLHDPKWARVAIDKLTLAHKQMPAMAQTQAWLGSAHALMARDFPVQGVWQVLPGPGFVRIYHVKTAESQMNKAVAKDPNDPVSVLIRASTLVSMPAILVAQDQAQADFDQLALWANAPDSNPGHADVLRSLKWRDDFHRLYAGAMEKFGHPEQALQSWHALVAETQEPQLKEFGIWNIARLSR